MLKKNIKMFNRSEFDAFEIINHRIDIQSDKLRVII